MTFQTVPKHLEHYVRLNSEARLDIEWWSQFCQTWNGISMMHLPNRASPTVVLMSDASGNWGCGAYSGTNWFMLPWSGSNTDYHITVKELIPIVITGGPMWHGAMVLTQCNNLAVVIVNHGMSKPGSHALGQMPSIYLSQV